MDIREKILAELQQAEAARIAGNEGRARVCARRAAGLAAREFLSEQETRSSDALQNRHQSESAFDLLQRLAELPGLSADLRQAAVYLTLRVTEDFILPVDVDLVAEARKLCTRLLST
jgi:hypothetical protein